jgi:hypothetical protein
MWRPPQLLNTYLYGGPFHDTRRFIPDSTQLEDNSVWQIPLPKLLEEATSVQAAKKFGDPWEQPAPLKTIFAIYCHIGEIVILTNTGAGKYKKYVYSGLEEK